MHCINLNNGENWNWFSKINNDDPAIDNLIVESIITTGLYSTFGIIGGSLLEREFEKKQHIYNIQSNVIIDSNQIIHASSGLLVNFNLDGKKKWFYELDKKRTSASKILETPNSILMINQGFAYKSNKAVRYGKTYLLSINKFTGKENYLNLLGKDYGIIKDYSVQNDTINILTDNTIIRYNIISGQKINEYNYKPYVNDEIVDNFEKRNKENVEVKFNNFINNNFIQ
jgi:hypothetical protein